MYSMMLYTDDRTAELAMDITNTSFPLLTQRGWAVQSVMNLAG
jgi:hypothetical protein